MQRRLLGATVFVAQLVAFMVTASAGLASAVVAGTIIHANRTAQGITTAVVILAIGGAMIVIAGRIYGVLAVPDEK